MGTIISRRDFLTVNKQVHQGVFLLTFKVALPSNTTSVNLGLLLGKRMFEAKINTQPIKIETELESLVNNYDGNIFLENADILFHPEYEQDVIKLLLQVGRNRKLYLLWPGTVTEARLTYSEPCRFDFKEYNIKDYVDTYVVLR